MVINLFIDFVCIFFLKKVLAEKGGSLNYDELVVYDNDAIRPSFLVMYEP